MKGLANQLAENRKAKGHTTRGERAVFRLQSPGVGGNFCRVELHPGNQEDRQERKDISAVPSFKLEANRGTGTVSHQTPKE